ncbi:unnamed protein product, partial [Ectocarpus fasciculatus]
MSARRSPRLSPGKATTANEPIAGGGGHDARGSPKAKRQRRATATEAAASGGARAASLEGKRPDKEEEDGPSAYELQRLAKMKENAMMMASLGLGGAKDNMRKAVNSDAAQRAKARGLGPRPNRIYPARSRESARVRGKTPEGLPMEDPEEAFNRRRQGFDAQGTAAAAAAASPRSPRIEGDVSMEATNGNLDGTVRLRQMMGGLVGRYDRDGIEEDYELAEPDDALKRLRGLNVEETGVCKVVRERAYSTTWHPSRDKLLLAVGDKVVGNVGLWTVDETDDNDAAHGVFQFKPHTGAVPRMTFDPLDGNKMLSTSYDGTVRKMDVEKGAFEQVI